MYYTFRIIEKVTFSKSSSYGESSILPTFLNTCGLENSFHILEESSPLERSNWLICCCYCAIWLAFVRASVPKGPVRPPMRAFWCTCSCCSYIMVTMFVRQSIRSETYLKFKFPLFNFILSSF